MPTGALINPMGSGETLSESEYTILQACLEMSRSEEKWKNAITSSIEFCATPEYKFQEFRFFMDHIVNEFCQDGAGMLVYGLREPVLLQSVHDWSHTEFDEPRALEGLLICLRRSGWFAHWLEDVILRYSHRDDNGHLDNELPSPLQVMGSLAEPAAKFETTVAAAKEIVESFPSLFSAKTEPAPAPPKPPAAAPASTAKKPRTGKKAA